MDIKLTTTVGEIVAKDFRTASIFSKYGIDFCCRGNVDMQTACKEKSIDIETLQKEIEQITQTPNTEFDFNSWSLDFLADYIENTYHKYIKETLPVLLEYLQKIVEAHGIGHPELAEIADLFSHSAADLTAHLQKEERILFPLIRELVKKQESGHAADIRRMSVESPIATMMYEHTVEGDRFDKISQLSGGYTTPEDACNTYRTAYAMLNEFEQKLHSHIALENNILFPKAIELEKLLNR